MKIMYLRKSRADNPYESVEEVLARHEKMLQEYAEREYGQTIPEDHIYREVVSGETIENRPVMQEVLRLIELPSVDGVLVVEPQRLSRGDLTDCGTVIKSFKYSRTNIITPTKTYDLWDKYDEKFFRDELLRGREYLEYTKEILTRGRKASSSEGWYIGSTAPFGYERCTVKVGSKERYTLKPHPQEADAVRIVFESFVYLRMSMTQIADKLGKMGFKPRRSDYFRADSIKTILENPVYIGMIAVGRRKRVENLVDGEIVVSTPRSQPEQIFPGKHPAIISEELFNAAQERIGTLPKIKKGKELRNPLAGIMQCSCGRGMNYTVGPRGNARLVCNDWKHCNNRSVAFYRIYEDIIDALKQQAHDFEVKVEAGADAAAEQAQRTVDSLESALRECEVQQERLFTFLESGTYDEATFRQRNKVLSDKRAELQRQYEEAVKSKPDVISYEEMVGTLHEAIDAMKADYLTAKQKNDFLKEVIEKVIYTPTGIEDDGTHWGKTIYKLDIFLRHGQSS